MFVQVPSFYVYFCIYTSSKIAPGCHGECECNTCNPCTITGQDGAKDKPGTCSSACNDQQCSCECHECPGCKECRADADDHSGHKCNTCNPCIIKKGKDGAEDEHGTCYSGCDEEGCDCKCHHGKIIILGWWGKGKLKQRTKNSGWLDGSTV